MASGAQATTYGYDPVGRLASVINDDGSQVFYNYDAAGNRFVAASVSPVLLPALAAVDDNFTYYYQTGAVTFDPRVNDTDHNTTLVGISTPQFGTAVRNGNTITYTGPASRLILTDAFSYTVQNAQGTYASALVTMVLNNTPPTAGPVSATVQEFSANNRILPNLSGPPTGGLTIVSAPASGGSASANPDLSMSYTPPSGFTGADSYQYAAYNVGGSSAPATVTVSVQLVPPVAQPTSTVVAQNSSNNPMNVSLAGGAATGVAVATSPSHGSASAAGLGLRYTPTAGYAGPDAFNYTASNGAGTSNQATASITVTATTLQPQPAAATVYENSSNTSIPLTVNGGTPLSLAVSSGPSHGSASSSMSGGAHALYTPTPGYSGSDAFQYTATDSNGTSPPATVSVTVQATLTASASSATWSWTQATNGQIHVTPTATITTTPAGGQGPYTYSWTRVSGEGTDIISANAPASSATAWTLSSGATNNVVHQAVWQCQVTDALGRMAYTGIVTVSMSRNTGQ